MASKPAVRVALMMTERGSVPSRNAVARRTRLRLFSSLSAVTSASKTEVCHERDNAACGAFCDAFLLLFEVGRHPCNLAPRPAP